ncbi:MAG: hypothetical protein N3D11_09810 [Candidatus Sumerlaeia bacterium]|nr:hypothetical protein [Candidatus Sumerlaeia bacterium]
MEQAKSGSQKEFAQLAGKVRISRNWKKVIRSCRSFLALKKGKKEMVRVSTLVIMHKAAYTLDCGSHAAAFSFPFCQIQLRQAWVPSEAPTLCLTAHDFIKAAAWLPQSKALGGIFPASGDGLAFSSGNLLPIVVSKRSRRGIFYEAVIISIG